MDANLIVPVVVGRVGGEKRSISGLRHRGEIVTRIAGRKDLGTGVAGGDLEASKIFRVGYVGSGGGLLLART